MHSDKRGAGNLRTLRQRVTKVMRRLNLSTLDDPYDLSPATTQRLLHQLELLHDTLEMKNAELQRTRLALQSSRSRFVDLLEYTSTLYNQAPVGYLTLTVEDVVVEANLTAVKFVATRREALLQKPFTDFIVEDDRDVFRNFRRELLATQRPQRCEIRLIGTDDSPLYVQVDGNVTKSILGRENLDESATTQGPYLRITLSDISARVHLEEEERRVRSQLEAALQDLRQTQEQMVRQERLAVVGQFAAGIAHDFNNIMASITLYTQLVMRASDLPSSLRKRMEVILAQSDRASSLVQQILDFSRRTTMARRPTALSEFLQHFIEMLQQMLPDNIQVTLEIVGVEPQKEDVAEIDPERIQQALLNLALNARDAMPDGGYLTVVLSRLQVDESMLTLATGTLPKGQWLRIELRDDGSGIRRQDLPRLFEPFFTTKDIGQGSGLGLSQVLGLVKQHNGEIDVTSEVGKGTTFTIYLPASSLEPPKPSAPEVMEPPRGNGELVLVVEDSDFLRAAVRSVLAQLGYTTAGASNGQEAFDYLIRERDKVSLILSDLSMPVMGGKELIRAVRSQGWDFPVIVLTGQPLSPPEIVQLQSYGQVRVLQKPVVMERLAIELHQFLVPQQ